jgi:Mg/Co/Ni transporter MgtE
MKEIEVGEYVRTENGIIDKVDSLCGMIENTVYLKQQSLWFNMDYIVNHSKQLMELIEVKDLVCFKNKLQNSLENEEMIIHIFDNDTLEEVKQAIEKGEIELLEILTHEQFEANCYKVGGEN